MKKEKKCYICGKKAVWKFELLNGKVRYYCDNCHKKYVHKIPKGDLE